jgi:Spy/CpxP family protein refolding chaperone
MRSKFLVAMALVMTAPTWAADPPPTVQPVNHTTGMTDDVVAQFRTDLMSKRADIMAKGLTLTSEQAAKFWPMFQEFQKEQDIIVNEQITSTKAYADHYQALSDEDAVSYIKALLARDQKMLDLRTKWLTKFQKTVPAKIAARAIQIDRRLSNVAQIQLSSQIPLVH